MKLTNWVGKALSSIRASGVAGSFWGRIHEPFAGAWQRNLEVDPRESLLAFSAVFSCVTGIASDIAKLRPKLMMKVDGIWEESSNSTYSAVLKKPNHYQTRLKFLEQWITSKLLHGNAYILKVRDPQGIVIRLYVLDPSRVTPMVSDSGDIFYSINRDNLSMTEEVILPASEIIHDMMVSLFHPLVGVSPIYACGRSASVGNSIQINSQFLFKNKSQPGGVLTAPGKISDEAARRLKEHWDNNYSGQNSGKVAVLGDGLKFEQMIMSAADAQLIEQLKWSVEDVARAFRYPMFKLGAGGTPISNNVEMLGLEYYSGCLQPLVEAFELCMDEGLGLPENMGVELDLDGLMRMDTTSLYASVSAGIAGGWMSPNEARAKVNLRPVDGGDSPFLQQQNYAIEDLAKLRSLEFEAMENPPEPPPPPMIEAPDTEDDDEPDEEEVTRALIERIKKGLAA
jgi:HK97 family phage portal protein